jgi:hypothetical protein
MKIKSQATLTARRESQRREREQERERVREERKKGRKKQISSKSILEAKAGRP